MYNPNEKTLEDIKTVSHKNSSLDAPHNILKTKHYRLPNISLSS